MLDILSSPPPAACWSTTRQPRRVRVVARGLSFANGVALSSDEQHLFVNENRQLPRLENRRGRAGSDIALGGKCGPGGTGQPARLPHNLMRGLDGKIWLGFAKPRNPTIDGMAGKPWLRAFTLRLPRALWPSQGLRPCDRLHRGRQGRVPTCRTPTGAYHPGDQLPPPRLAPMSVKPARQGFRLSEGSERVPGRCAPRSAFKRWGSSVPASVQPIADGFARCAASGSGPGP